MTTVLYLQASESIYVRKTGLSGQLARLQLSE